ncbi:dihydrolipoamide acetyltransferase family protein [Streptomyces nodosus]|uniref:Dihydrolipoamide acetyltransferase component of pyruvate dehydrogenase complex n=1 Tax=Streptomyces nodosus TaxID=40318 RepID=A0A0B5DNK7_9ACTN|nr:dihydrolipoamide acetyltransferase family protein [Streptomyces nodosus]AJE41602.1 branched-chain alpha-keto acid dehydrogenase subunit E2 [Streptomyces nodosus]MBB4792804.1 pyruvate dehydrogenase E2 component (dihydrolipoamide acetyltransferase) [Streptomyces nodosus]QEV40133.1 2-oxo acid dehydrogenase subunit E2 [Streptomyces nodosus]
MTQVLEFRLPDLGEGLTEAEIVRWLVQVGDVVAVDQPVVEVETAKAMVEVPCPHGGVVTARFGEEGTELPVGAPLLTVAIEATADAAPESSGNVLVGYGTSAAPARRRRVRPSPPGTRLPDGASRTAGRGTAGASADPGPAPLPSSEVLTSAVAPGGTRGPAVPDRHDGPVAVISPLVRRLARDNGVDLRLLAGSGPDGLILRADVEDVLRTETARAGATAARAATAAGAVRGAAGAQSVEAASGALGKGTSGTSAAGTRVPLKGVRGAVADKLSRSRREIPDATCWVDADATELMRARAAMNAAGGPKISLIALLARICTAALARFPELNSTVDLEAREIVRLPQVHLGFAAQTERGLVVPVVRDAHTRDAESLTAEFARLTEAARTGTLTPGELTGGTFTLNNYGVFGVDGSTPIINHPEAAMLGVGRIVPKPWVHEGELAVRQVVQLSLTFDHRVCDGGTAGGFLRHVADCVEQPAVLLRTL